MAWKLAKTMFSQRVHRFGEWRLILKDDTVGDGEQILIPYLVWRTLWHYLNLQRVFF